LDSYNHLHHVARLDKSDEHGARGVLPFAMLQLDLDQECYDFIKWYEKHGLSEDAAFGTTTTQFSDIIHAHPHQELNPANDEYHAFQHNNAMLLLKLKLLVDVINIRLARAVIAVTATTLPPELCTRIELNMVRSPVSRRWILGTQNHSITEIQHILETQIVALADICLDVSWSFLDNLLDPKSCSCVDKEPNIMPLDLREPNLVPRFSYSAWYQHEGVIELLQSTNSIAAINLEEDVDRVMKKSVLRPCSSQKLKKIHINQSERRFWRFLKDAARDAVDLNPTSASDIGHRRSADEAGQGGFDGNRLLKLGLDVEGRR
jgi:hypothetical protein